MKKILIVDDEKELRELIKEKLIKNNFDAITACDGKEAVVLAQSEKPDLILLDVVMPDIDGYETCKRLKQNNITKDIPVLFLTGKDLDPQSMIKRYSQLGACGFIPKPSTLKELMDKINEALI